MKPIIMGAESVRAILEGRKTMTRRVVNSRLFIEIDNGDELPVLQDSPNFGEALMKYGRYPYGYIGDRLWVRESWAEAHYWTNDVDAETPIYRASDYKTPIKPVVWKSPMFMPRWASRITLEITDIRVERLQDITNNDAKSEGVEPEVLSGHYYYLSGYHELWQDLNAKRGYPWKSNPWVWVISFKRIHDQKEDV